MAPTFRVPAEPLPAAMAYRGSSPEFDGESPRSPRVARVGAAANAASGVSWSARWSAGRPWRLQLRRDAADADQVRVTFDEDELEWLVSPAGRARVAEAVRPRPSSWSPKLDGVSLADRGVTEPNIVAATRRVRDGMSSWRHDENIEPAPAGAMALVNGRLPVQLVTLGAAADPPLAGDHGEAEQAGALGSTHEGRSWHTPSSQLPADWRSLISVAAQRLTWNTGRCIGKRKMRDILAKLMPLVQVKGDRQRRDTLRRRTRSDEPAVPPQ